MDTFLPGVPAHAARGAISGVDCHLVLTNNDDQFDMGWSVLLATLTSPVQGMTLTAQIPRGDAAERGSLIAGSDDRSLILSTLDGGAHDRKAEELKAFLAAGEAIVARLIPRRGCGLTSSVWTRQRSGADESTMEPRWEGRRAMGEGCGPAFALAGLVAVTLVGVASSC